MKTKHTPAPWYPVEIAGIYMLLDSDNYEGKNLFDSEDVGEAKAKANAKLAAAAKDLLYACLEIRKTLGALIDFKGMPEQDIKRFELIQNAIKKATE